MLEYDDDEMMRIFITAQVANDAAVRETRAWEREISFVYLNISCFIYISHCKHAAAERMRARKFFHYIGTYTRCAHRIAKRKWKLPFYFCLFSRLAFLCVIMCVCFFNRPLFCAIFFFHYIPLNLNALLNEINYL